MLNIEDLTVGMPVYVTVVKPIVGADEFVGTVLAINHPYIRVSNATKPKDTTSFSIVYTEQLSSVGYNLC
ncbi:conserved hypothetical protein [Vibrio phage 275E43-1]|nr:conserved hypothetical protein [Vibrio phage 275E43-1]